MAKSQESWNKKEAEKKRQLKQKEKEQKKETRRTSSKEGKSLEEMMAYVDENGNISSVPPNPNQPRSPKKEDISISVAKQDPSAVPVLRKGTVAFFNTAKGYGFIEDQETKERIFVHGSGLVDAISENNLVTFKVEKGMKGPNAVDVRVVG